MSPTYLAPPLFCQKGLFPTLCSVLFFPMKKSCPSKSMCSFLDCGHRSRGTSTLSLLFSLLSKSVRCVSKSGTTSSATTTKKNSLPWILKFENKRCHPIPRATKTTSSAELRERFFSFQTMSVAMSNRIFFSGEKQKLLSSSVLHISSAKKSLLWVSCQSGKLVYIMWSEWKHTNRSNCWSLLDWRFPFSDLRWSTTCDRFILPLPSNPCRSKRVVRDSKLISQFMFPSFWRQGRSVWNGWEDTAKFYKLFCVQELLWNVERIHSFFKLKMSFSQHQQSGRPDHHQKNSSVWRKGHVLCQGKAPLCNYRQQ